MRVGPGRVVAAAATQPQPGEGVDAGALGAVDRLLHRGLEVVREVEHDVCPLHASNGPGRELDVVWLGAGWGQVLDVDLRASDRSSREGERIEGGDHRPLPLPGTGTGAAGSEQRNRGGERDGNDSHQSRR